MKQANYDHLPSPIEAVGDGSHLYRWSIEEVTTEATEDQESYTSWNCYEINVAGTLTASAITAAVIAAVWSSSDEKKLINDYNAAVQGILDGGGAEAYTEFLTQRKILKEQIAADFKAWAE